MESRSDAPGGSHNDNNDNDSTTNGVHGMTRRRSKRQREEEGEQTSLPSTQPPSRNSRRASANAHPMVNNSSERFTSALAQAFSCHGREGNSNNETIIAVNGSSNNKTSAFNKRQRTTENGATVTESDMLTFPMSVADEMLKCTVCFCLAEKSIFQCSNGHLLCDGCHNRVLSTDEARCPTCRIRLSRSRPCRSTVAEQTRARFPSNCPHVNCTASLLHSELEAHMEQCSQRKATCTYAQIGCNWVGVADVLARHENTCEFAFMTGAAIMKRLRTNNELNEKVMADKKVTDVHAEIISMLGSRCRDIVVRDVRLENDAVVGDFSSTPFHACGELWTAKIEKRTTRGVVSAVVLCLSRGRAYGYNAQSSVLTGKRLASNVVILPGPNLPETVKLAPSVHKCMFKKGVYSTKNLKLAVDKASAANMLKCGTVQLRIVFVDIRGGLERQFTSKRDNPALFRSDAAATDDENDVESGADSGDNEHVHGHGRGRDGGPFEVFPAIFRDMISRGGGPHFHHHHRHDDHDHSGEESEESPLMDSDMENEDEHHHAHAHAHGGGGGVHIGLGGFPMPPPGFIPNLPPGVRAEAIPCRIQ